MNVFNPERFPIRSRVWATFTLFLLLAATAIAAPSLARSLHAQLLPSSSLLLLLDHNCHSTRSKWRALASNPLFSPRYDISLLEAKDLALKRLQLVADAKVFSVFDFLSRL